ncbi:MAG: AbrB/MazE/SpoVT family DNA-binding domain-containing protein [Ruminococcaceae bacterium]|nr:AbrB/MazE/SpoVT family DNA-binding domain-containing protein [Oscillospiraceae bacterium]
MKSTGIVRRIDKMGRIVLPMETRTLLNLNEEGAAVEIYTENDMMILKKYVPSCLFCSNTENLIEYHGVKICENCINTLSEKSKEIL